MATVGNAREVDINGNDNSLEIEEIARYAVQEHNKKENALLEFGKVLRVTKKVVSGTLYDVKFEATDGGQKKVYEAKVWVKPWESFKELQEFKLVGESDTA